MQILECTPRFAVVMAVLVILAALILYYPMSSVKFALVSLQCVPSLAICAFFLYVCKDRIMALLALAGGAGLGWLACPTVWVNGEERTWFDDYLKDWLLWPTYTAIGTLVAGVAIFAIEFGINRMTSHDRKRK